MTPHPAQGSWQTPVGSGDARVCRHYGQGSICVVMRSTLGQVCVLPATEQILVLGSIWVCRRHVPMVGRCPTQGYSLTQADSRSRACEAHGAQNSKSFAWAGLV